MQTSPSSRIASLIALAGKSAPGALPPGTAAAADDGLTFAQHLGQRSADGEDSRVPRGADQPEDAARLGQPHELRPASGVARLRRHRIEPSPNGSTPDAAALQDLLARWPAALASTAAPGGAQSPAGPHGGSARLAATARPPHFEPSAREQLDALYPVGAAPTSSDADANSQATPAQPPDNGVAQQGARPMQRPDRSGFVVVGALPMPSQGASNLPSSSTPGPLAAIPASPMASTAPDLAAPRFPEALGDAPTPAGATRSPAASVAQPPAGAHRGEADPLRPPTAAIQRMSHGAPHAAAMRREAQAGRAIDAGDRIAFAAATPAHREAPESGTSDGANSGDRRIGADGAVNDFVAPPTANPSAPLFAAEDVAPAPSRDAANAQTAITNAATPAAAHHPLATTPAALPWAIPGEGTHRPVLEPLARSGERLQTAAVQERRGPDRPVLAGSPGSPGDDLGVRATREAALPRPADGHEPAAAESAPSPVASAPARVEAAAVALAPGSAPVAAAARTAEADIAAPAGSAQFREAFVLQVSAFARDGVQNAQLHLNPAEMGPISVQIALDGQQAQIHFGSDSQHTRALVEASLPALAAALREEGLTLSGGGVSQHTPNRQFDAPSEAGARARHDVPDPAQPAAAMRRVALGRLDTYA